MNNKAQNFDIFYMCVLISFWLKSKVKKKKKNSVADFAAVQK